LKTTAIFILLLVAIKLFAQDSSSIYNTKITEHSLKTTSGTIEYEAEAGYMKWQDSEGEHKANFFFVAYTKKGATNRPVTFCFNGGPGSSSLWLHMGAVGPKRVVMTDFGDAPKPPHEITDNEYSWLAWTDLVFIDPVNTGFSRAKDEKNKFLGRTQGDAPEIDGVVYVSGNGVKVGEMYKVRIEDTLEYDLIGKKI